MSSAPPLSVVLPVRNGMPFIRDAVASVLSQTFDGFELLVIDDGSTDTTREWLGTQADPRIRLITSRGIGVVAALNTGLFEARGGLVARQDADDLSYPQRFEIQTAFLRDHGDIDVVGTLTDFIDEKSQPAETPWVADVRRVHDAACTSEALGALLPLTCGLAHGTVMARTPVLQQAGGYRPAFEWAEDYDLWLRLLPDHRFAKIPQRLYRHRLHTGQVSVERRNAQLTRTIAAKLEYICRRYPHAVSRAGVSVQGEGRGAVEYRRAAEGLGLTLVNESGLQPTNGRPCVVVISDLALLEQWKATLGDGDWRWEGNIAVRVGPDSGGKS